MMIARIADLGGSWPAGKPIDVDLAPAGARGRTGQRSQFVRQLVRIVRERIEVLARHHHRTHIAVWIHAHTSEYLR